MNTNINRIIPSEVSRLIAGQHHDVARAFTELSPVVGTLPVAGPPAPEYARELCAALCDQLLEHIAIEMDVLVPALRDADAWGACRADQLIGRLERRRREIDAFRRSLTSLDGAILMSAVRRFIDHRRGAMERAKLRDLDVLRDDVVGIDCSGG